MFATTVRFALSSLAIGLYLASPAPAAITWMSLDADAGVLTTGDVPANNGDNVTKWEDQSNGFDATVPGGSTSPTYLTATGTPAERGVSFTDSADRLRVVGSQVISGTTDFGISAHVLGGVIPGGGLNERVIASTYGISGAGNGFEFYVFNANRVHFYVGDVINAQGNAQLESTTLLVPGTWYDLKVTRSGDVFNLYVNGILEDTDDFADERAAASIAQISFSGTDLTIGNLTNYGNIPFASSIHSINIVTPEPTGMLLTCFGGIVAAWRRRRR
jgi:hypothetical protein